MAIEKLQTHSHTHTHRSPDIDQILAELIKAGVEQFALRTVNLINSLWNEEELPEEWKESIIVPIYKKGDKTDYSTYTGLSLCQLPTKFYPILCYQG
jgi:hypothetical protein